MRKNTLRRKAFVAVLWGMASILVAPEATSIGHAGEGLFDDIIGEVDKGTQLKEWAKKVFQEAHDARIRSVFTVEAGKPTGTQNTKDERGNIKITVPVTIRINEDAYEAFLLALKKAFSNNPFGLDFTPEIFTASMNVDQGRSRIEIDYSEVGKFLTRYKDRDYVRVITKIDEGKKQAVMEIFSIDPAIVKGYFATTQTSARMIRVDILDENGESIATGQARLNSGCELFNIGSGRGGYIISVSPGYPGGYDRPAGGFPILQKSSAGFSLSEETLRKARSFRCVPIFE